MYYNLIILAVLILLSGFFSGAEIALFSISLPKVKSLVKKKVKNSRSLLKLKENPESLIITILIGNNIVNISSSAIATATATNYFGSIGIGIAIGIMTFLILVFGEIFPKNYAFQNAEKISLASANTLLFLRAFLSPLIIFFVFITKITMNMAGSKRRGIFSEDELTSMMEMGIEERKLLRYEKEFMEGILKFNDLTANDVLTPRNYVFCLDQNTSIKKAVTEVNKNRFSRIPITDKEKDKVVGILLLRDLLKAYTHTKKIKIF